MAANWGFPDSMVTPWASLGNYGSGYLRIKNVELISDASDEAISVRGVDSDAVLATISGAGITTNAVTATSVSASSGTIGHLTATTISTPAFSSSEDGSHTFNSSIQVNGDVVCNDANVQSLECAGNIAADGVRASGIVCDGAVACTLLASSGAVNASTVVASAEIDCDSLHTNSISAASVAASCSVTTNSLNCTTARPGSIICSGAASIGGALTVCGNLTVNGNQTTLNGATLTTVDNLARIASQNTTADITDYGMYGVYNDGSGVKLSGLIRSAASKKYALFKDLAGSADDGPATTLTLSNSNYAGLGVSGLDLVGTSSTASLAGPDSGGNVVLSGASKVRITAPTEWRYPCADVSATSLTLTAAGYGTLYRISNTGFNSITVPSQASADSGAFWEFLNSTTSSLAITFTGGVGLSSYTLAAGSAFKLYWNGSSNYIVSGGGGSALQSTSVKAYSEAIISNAVSAGNSTATTIASFAVPSGMLSKTGFLTGYFYLKNATSWPVGTSIRYGFAVDGTLVNTFAGALPLYTHSAANSGYMLKTDGTGGFTMPVTFPVSIGPSATNFNLVVSNSSIPLVTSQVGSVATSTFTYTGSVQSFTVPSNISSLQVHIWAAGGGTQDGSNGPGTVPGVGGNPTRQGSGSGGYTTGYLSVTPSSTIYLVVGGIGGGTIVTGGGASGFTGASGGGFSGIFSANPTGMTASQAAAVCLCLAGGGGAAGVNNGAALGGAGGGTTGASASQGGTGGSQTAGGTGGSSGSLMAGGASGSGGAGGAGLYGGGGGASSQAGGGGSGYLGSLVNGTTTQGNSATNYTTWASPPQYSLMQSLFGSSVYYGGAYQNGAIAITTQGTYPTYIGSELTAVY